jgi:Proteobacterial lipase chaperone protein
MYILNNRTWLLTGAALIAVALAVIFSRGERPATTVPVSESKPKLETHRPNAAAPGIEDRTDIAPQPGAEEWVDSIDDAQGSDRAFRTNAAGDLVVDEHTRVHIEALVASSDPNELSSAIREQTVDLPPAAASRAEELVNQFVQYQQAQRQTYPPDDAPVTEDDAVRELEGLHALREAHFGADVARLFYAKEEALAREMIEVLRVENDASLTAQEKLERARALREQLPGVAAIEKNNREAAMQNDQGKN